MQTVGFLCGGSFRKAFHFYTRLVSTVTEYVYGSTMHYCFSRTVHIVDGARDISFALFLALQITLSNVDAGETGPTPVTTVLSLQNLMDANKFLVLFNVI